MKRMKMALTMALMALLGGAGAGFSAEDPHRGHGASGKGAGLSLQGEVLDMACYMAHEGKGPKHKSCAQKCIDGGAAAGLLTADGAVYLLVEDHANAKAYKAVKGWAGDQVKLGGDVFSRGGVTALVVKSAEKIK